MKIIAHIQTDFPDKFGIPRQSGIIEELKGKIVFEPEYRRAEAVRGLEEFSHIWLNVIDWGAIHQIRSLYMQHNSLFFILLYPCQAHTR